MKLKKIITITILIIAIINIRTFCFAKYVFDYNKKVADLDIDRTPPILNIEYSTTEITRDDIQVKIIANEKIQEVEGWTLLEDGITLIKIYDKNMSEEIIIKDLSGNESIANIVVNNIDRKPPIAELLEVRNTNKGYERYANNAHEMTLKIKIYDENEIVNNLKDFEILVNTKEAVCTKEIEIIEKERNYIIYQIQLTNILENGKLEVVIPENSFQDIAGNVMKEVRFDTNILIDNIAPILKYTPQKLENGMILAQILSNEPIRKIDGWAFDKEQKNISKNFISDINYMRELEDFAGNKTITEIKIENSTYLGLETVAHISNIGWVRDEVNYIGSKKRDPRYKVEALMIRTNEKIDKDFLNVASYVHTYWGQGSSAISHDFKVKYDYGFNPISGYKNMGNSNLVKYQNKDYIHLGGEGINLHGSTDINGNNPIPIEIANNHKYGISGIKLNLKEINENSVIYQTYLSDSGWNKSCKNGEQAMKSEDKPISAIRIAVVPSSEIEIIEKQWNKDIGTHNLK